MSAAVRPGLDENLVEPLARLPEPHPEALRNAGGVWRTEGHRRFAKELGGKQIVIALRLGISVPHVSQIMSGLRRPSLDLAFAIQHHFGIPMWQWCLPSEGTESG